MYKKKPKPLHVERNLQKALAPFIIEAALPKVLHLLSIEKVRVDFSQRKGRTLGYYIAPREEPTPYFKPGFGQMHTISLQIDLNPYALLFIFLHEWAHLLTSKQYGETVAAHGKEWKNNFRRCFAPFHSTDIFPEDILSVIDDYFIRTGRYFEEELDEACQRYGATRADFRRTYLDLLRKGVKIPAPYMGPDADALYDKALEEKEQQRIAEIKKELEIWNRAQKEKEEAARLSPVYTVVGNSLLSRLEAGTLFRLEGVDYKVVTKENPFVFSEVLSDGRVVKIHALVSVEILASSHQE